MKRNLTTEPRWVWQPRGRFSGCGVRCFFLVHFPHKNLTICFRVISSGVQRHWCPMLTRTHTCTQTQTFDNILLIPFHFYAGAGENIWGRSSQTALSKRCHWEAPEEGARPLPHTASHQQGGCPCLKVEIAIFQCVPAIWMYHNLKKTVSGVFYT